MNGFITYAVSALFMALIEVDKLTKVVISAWKKAAGPTGLYLFLQFVHDTQNRNMQIKSDYSMSAVLPKGS